MIAASLNMLCRYLQRSSTVTSFHRSRLKNILGRTTIENGRVKRGHESEAVHKHLDSPHGSKCPVLAALKSNVDPPEIRSHHELRDWIRRLPAIE